eukprot:347916_1
MSKSCTERCEQLKSVFQQVESFEFLGVKQTNSADVVVLSWNGSKKFNANQIKIDIQKFIKNSTLKLPDNESWRPVGFPAFEKPSTKNCIVFHPKKRSKKLCIYKEQSKWLYGYRKVKHCFLQICYANITILDGNVQTKGIAISVPHAVIISNTNDESENIEDQLNDKEEKVENNGNVHMMKKRKQYKINKFREDKNHWSDGMLNMKKKIGVMDRVNGLQYVQEENDEYWMGHMDYDEFANWFEAYEFANWFEEK